MHFSPFKKVNKTPTNSGTGFYYIVPGYKFTRDEAKKTKRLLESKKSQQKPIYKKDISKPHPLN
ncbi:hypothetical protein AMATHDRAFT_10604 [Amanita thiersii Skay4041]|uniref:Uncharacterized protein n=1 Tax=Amanita thiersii Skay4041 TaxID=703135 RepID=A0A2A9N9J5_9AGAR|nr:hypothetical protein AMATHDRAFT_10604 [Amanita thiersii Skay4041]